MDSRVALVTVAWTLAFVLGCSGAAVQDAELPLSAKSQRLKLNDSGGYGPVPCDLGGDQYTFETITRQLDFGYCDDSTVPSASVTGTRTLSTAEADSIAQALDQVRPSDAKTCGADASDMTLDVTTANGLERYADDFYSGCPSNALAGRLFVTGLPNLYTTFDQLARVNAR